MFIDIEKHKATKAASSFSTIDNQASKLKRRIMEAIYIQAMGPIMNKTDQQLQIVFGHLSIGGS